MKRACLIFCLTVSTLRAWGIDATPSRSASPFVPSTWPGIEMHIPEIKRIGDNRLLVVVELRASATAPSSTLIGTPPVYPPHPTKQELKMDLPPTPFSLQGAIMTEDRTQVIYEVVAPSSKPPFYRASAILATLSPGKSLYLTIQFMAPPVPAPENGIEPKQTVTILLPKAKGIICKVVIPPPALASP